MSGRGRHSVQERAAGRCEYCRLPDFRPPLEDFHLEHIVARQHGGGTTSENLAWACHRCNRHKGTNLTGIDPATREVVALYHPRRDIWHEHFTVEDVRLRGLPATGRATVWLLQRNAQRRLERRAELMLRGWY